MCFCFYSDWEESIFGINTSIFLKLKIFFLQICLNQKDKNKLEYVKGPFMGEDETWIKPCSLRAGKTSVSKPRGWCGCSCGMRH